MRKLVWNLSDLFLNEDAFREAMDHVKQKLMNIKSYETVGWNAEVLYDVLEKKWMIMEQSNNILLYGSLCYYKDVKNKDCIERKEIVEAFQNEVGNDLAFVDRKILAIGYEQIKYWYQKKNELRKYQLWIDNLFRRQKHIQSQEKNVVLQKNQNTINQKLSEYNTLLNNMKYGSIEIDGKEIEIKPSNYGKYISSRHRDTRKQTYQLVNEAYIEKQELYATILNDIYGLRIENSKLEHYDTVLEKVLFEENIDSKIIDVLIASVQEHLPLLKRYLSLKASYLNMEHPHLYDLGVPMNQDKNRKYTVEQAIEIIKQALAPL